MSDSEFSISVHDLDAAGKSFRLPLRAAWIRSALEGTDVGSARRDGELDVRLSKSGTDVVVRGTLAAELTVPCARCLEPATVAVREELSALAVPASSAAPGRGSPAAQADEFTDAGEADVLAYDGETVVLDSLVRDELLLGIPMIPLCSETCTGIRAQASEEGAEASIDPRFRPLLRLKSKT
jgi:uncharacterized protein